MSDIFSPKEPQVCANCGESYLSGLPYCPHCGLGKKKIFRSNSDTNMPFVPWAWVWATLLIIPLAACGGCMIHVSSVHSDSDLYRIGGYYITAQFVSVCTGIVLSIVNASTANRKRK